jgi:hypothetical protein
MDRQCIGLSPPCVEMILQNEFLPETKLVLIAMFQRGVSSVYFADLREQLAASTISLEMARLQLVTNKIAKNVNRYDLIELSDKWDQLIQENKNDCLRNWPNSASSSSDTDGPESEVEADLSENKIRST